MAAKLSDLVGESPDGGPCKHATPDAKELQESEALGDSPSCLPSWSPARSLLSSHPNTKHCQEISVTLTGELGAPTLSFLDGTPHGRYAA